jgi:hypothetical protein
MSDQITYAYAGDIVKAVEDDGSLIVYGKATGPDLDLDEQVCDPSWLAKAMPAWMQWGNLREMHQPVAAGIGIELAAEGDDWMLKSKVVDEGTAKKIEAGALKGYSIGIKGAKVVKDAAAPGGRIVGGEIVEVSYVDRPCNPTAVAAIAKGVGLSSAVEAAESERLYEYAEDVKEIVPDAQEAVLDEAALHQVPAGQEYPEDDAPCSTCNGLGELVETGETCETCGGSGRVNPADREHTGIPASEIVEGEKAAEPEAEKKDYSDKERESMAESGQAMEGGGFPIKTVADLRNAIQSIGRAKDPAAAKAHVKARAEALGREDLIPDGWKAADADVEKVEHNAADLEAVRSSLIALIKAELDEMLSGEEEEIGDVHDLLCTLGIFLEWWEHEAAEGETDQPFTKTDDEAEEAEMDYTMLGVNADLIKTAKTGEPEAIEALRSEVVKALGVEDLRAEIETAKAAQKEQIELLTSELERIKEMAAPGGPAITRTTAQSRKSAEAERLQSEAAYYRKMASQVVDVDLARGYHEQAAKMDRDASALIDG